MYIPSVIPVIHLKLCMIIENTKPESKEDQRQKDPQVGKRSYSHSMIRKENHQEKKKKKTLISAGLQKAHHIQETTPSLVSLHYQCNPEILLK